MKAKKYPLATIIGYGPDSKRATKLVVSIFRGPGEREGLMEKWLVPEGDIRQNPVIQAEVAAFIKRHHAVETVANAQLLGCPHEEGIDYPEGGVCPHCPFWANVDRHTLEPKSLDQPLTPEQILAGLSRRHTTQPLISLAAVELYRDQMVEPLVAAVERGLQDPENTPEGEALLFSYALAFLAKWREPRAYPLIIRWLSLPGEQAYAIGGDTVSEWGARLLASVCAGDLEPIKQLIQNPEANEFCRWAALDSLAVLAAWGERPMLEIMEYFRWLAREGLERQENCVWSALCSACADLELIPVFDDVRRAYNQGLIDNQFIHLQELDEIEAAPDGLAIDRFREKHPPFTDIAKETAWWSCFNQDTWAPLPPLPDNAFENVAPPEYQEPPPYIAPQPYVAPPKIGRNDPCPCGSGKKYKKCCGQ